MVRLLQTKVTKKTQHAEGGLSCGYVCFSRIVAECASKLVHGVAGMDVSAMDFGQTQNFGLGVVVAELGEAIDELGSGVFAPQVAVDDEVVSEVRQRAMVSRGSREFSTCFIHEDVFYALHN